MKHFGILILWLAILTSTQIVFGQRDSQIKNIQKFNAKSGIAYTSDAVFRTDDGGRTWGELPLSRNAIEKVAAVSFISTRNVYAVLTDLNTASVILARSRDGGASWIIQPAQIDPDKLSDVDLSGAEISENGDGVINFAFRLMTSSNFVGRIEFSSVDAGNSWQLVSRSVELNSDEAPAAVTSGNWILKTGGTCEAKKAGCIQETQIIADGNEITPPQIKALAAVEKESAEQEAEVVPMFALPPGGTTRISLNRGYDKCQAGSVAQMQIWWDNSPHYISNIYFSGRNRACPSQPLNTTWINQVTAMGWGLIPTVVGYQSPCTASTTTAKLSYDPVVSEQQGRGEADIAVTDATNIGLTTGSILYYDMERYDPPSPDTLGCRTATVAFLKGWTDRIKELGYKSGVYGSPKNAQEDWVNLPPASKMDAIWMARWDNVPSVWTYVTFPNFPTTEWVNHQRIKQWQAPHNETWGGVMFNIDGNIADAPIAGLAIANNKNADFDGDGKSDISVFRPSSGVWYVLNSSNSASLAVLFGTGTDILSPGDFDGDGKTDFSVFRPADGGWHILTKAGFYTARQFGANGDIPVPADYNGDGKTDVAVFRPSDGVWYISNSDSRGTYTFTQFGFNGDKPVPADYDGDGKTDIAVYRPTSGVWYVLRSSDGNFTATAFGVSTDLPAQDDYDGDGKADFVVYRDGIWYLLQTAAGFTALQFGVAGDIPSTGDYDGDGKADVAVFRPSSGVWYLLRSQSGVTSYLFGVTGDRPIPNAYLPQ